MAERSRIFISYRHSCDSLAASWLAEDLSRHFGDDRVFRDVNSIAPGVPWPDALEKALAMCAAFLVVIGPNWLTAIDSKGRRRLALADDWVRREVAEILERREARVFPLLVDAQMPDAEDLPEPLKRLTEIEAFTLTARHWSKDVVELIEFLEKVPGLSTKNEKRSEGIERQPNQRPREDRLVRGQSFRDVLKGGGEGPLMKIIPAGRFLMGSPTEEPERRPSEGPEHEVHFAAPFAIGAFEVTFDEYDSFCDSTQRERPKDEGWGRGSRPVIHVSWDDAQAYCAWLSVEAGRAYRLPTEAEWEYACRAGAHSPFHFGPRITTDQANFNGNGTYNGSPKGEFRMATSPVGSFSANAFGLHDMHGNVWEWCQDAWHETYDGAPQDGAAWEDGGDGPRVIRGGSWEYLPGDCRSAYRYHCDPRGNCADMGIRLCCASPVA